MLVNEVSYEKVMKTIISANKILNDYTNHDPFFIAKQLGIRVIFEELTDNVKAFITKDSYGPMIFIHKSADSLSQKILCFHEIGHFVNDDIGLIPDFFDIQIDQKKEYLANVFTSILYPQATAHLKADSHTDIKVINAYFDSLIKLKKETSDPSKGLYVLGDNSTIFDI